MDLDWVYNNLSVFIWLILCLANKLVFFLNKFSGNNNNNSSANNNDNDDANNISTRINSLLVYLRGRPTSEQHNEVEWANFVTETQQELVVIDTPEVNLSRRHASVCQRNRVSRNLLYCVGHGHFCVFWLLKSVLI